MVMCGMVVCSIEVYDMVVCGMVVCGITVF